MDSARCNNISPKIIEKELFLQRKKLNVIQSFEKALSIIIYNVCKARTVREANILLSSNEKGYRL